jgi:hypothetical protein
MNKSYDERSGHQLQAIRIVAVQACSIVAPCLNLGAGELQDCSSNQKSPCGSNPQVASRAIPVTTRTTYGLATARDWPPIHIPNPESQG